MKNRSWLPVRYQSPLLLLGTWVVTVAVATVGVQLLANSLPAEPAPRFSTKFEIATTPVEDASATVPFPLDALIPGFDVGVAATATAPAGVPVTLPELPSDLSGIPVPPVTLPTPPAVSLPALPKGLKPALAIPAPAVSAACGNVSTTGVVLGFMAPSTPGGIAGQVPAWLVPTYAACGAFSAPTSAISCAADPATPVVAGVPHLPYTLTPFAMLVHEVLALEAAAGLPSTLSDTAQARFGCSER